MSHMKGDLLTKTRKLVKCLAKPEPRWLKAMEQAPPVTFPCSDGKLKAICLPEDKYVTIFYRKYPDSKHEDPIKFNSFNPVPARVFAWRVLELKEQGVNQEEAIAAADMEYRTEMRAKKQAYARLKQIAKIQGKKPEVPNPYPSAIRQIQAEERKHVRDRFNDPEVIDIARKMQESRLAEQAKFRTGGM
ncbi:hypothetical protein V2J09_019964 [Rumex salicifolius]